MSIEVDLQEVTLALANALDLVGVDAPYHGKRTAFVAQAIGRAGGCGEQEVAELLQAGLLHDCGVSSTRVHRKVISELEWSGAEEHCRLGHRLISDFSPLSHLAPAILYHHTRWEDLGAAGLSARVARRTNTVFLADRIDSLIRQHDGADLLLARSSIQDAVRAHAGALFSPEAVDAWRAASDRAAFWLSLEPECLRSHFGAMASHDGAAKLDIAQLRNLAKIFAQIVDAKSRFTAEHSLGVARLSYLFAELSGLPESRCAMVEVAGLLHDIGKLSVPDEILDKEGPLEADERAVIMRHSFETYQILSQVSGLKDIAHWASVHHEKLSGNGYPFHYGADELSLEGRIIAVADIFQALAQDRPYRKPYSSEKVISILREMASRGDLDPDIVGLAEQNLDASWRAATGAH